MDNYERDFDESDLEADHDMSDDEEMENVQSMPSDAVIQSMMLFKLYFRSNDVGPRARVGCMIDEYNSKISNEMERYNIYYTDDFADVYKQTKCKEKATTLYHGTTKNPQEITNYITVYYSEDGNAFAQTSGNGWRVVSQYGDTDFPVKVSERLLDQHGMKSRTNVPLSGNTVLQQKRCKRPERSYECGTQKVRIRFTADLRPNASIRNPDLNCFLNSEKRITVKVASACIQFECGIKKDGMRNFINHLNKICNGEVTRTTDDREERPTDAFEESLRLANEHETKCLNNELKVRIESYIKKEDDFSKHLSDLDLCERDVATFSGANNFKVCIKRTKVPVTGIPTLETTLDTIRQKIPTTILTGRMTNDIARVYTITDRFFISYDQQGRKKKRSMFDLIEGTMMYNDQMFHRVGRKWYYMTEDHIRGLHLTFRKFLRDHLTTDNTMILGKPWKDDYPENEYNALYMRERDFLVGDDCTYGNVELFDLLKYDPKTQNVFLYHVKKKLGGEIRTLAFQVMAATDIVANIHTYNDVVQTNFQAYHSSIVQNYRKRGWAVPVYFDSSEKLRHMLSRKNKITIICAVLDGNPRDDCTIRKEKDKTDYIRIDDISVAYNNLNPWKKSQLQRYFNNNSASDICYDIFQCLIDNGYVNDVNASSCGNGVCGYATSKLLIAHQIPNRPNDNNYFKMSHPSIDKIIWEMVRRFASFFESTNAKYSFMQMQTSGFDFKICQIKRFVAKPVTTR